MAWRRVRSSMPSRLFLAALAAAAGVVSCGPQQKTSGASTPATTRTARALAQARTEWPQLTIEVLEASRTGSTLLVRFRVANQAPQSFEFGDRFAADPADRDTLADVALLDPSGQRKYFVLRDGVNRPACSTGLAPLKPGETRELFARFPAPAANASRITIQIPHVPDIRDVPITGSTPQ